MASLIKLPVAIVKDFYYFGIMAKAKIAIIKEQKQVADFLLKEI